MRTCPECGGEVQPAAILCRHCKRPLPPAGVAAPPATPAAVAPIPESAARSAGPVAAPAATRQAVAPVVADRAAPAWAEGQGPEGSQPRRGRGAGVIIAVGAVILLGCVGIFGAGAAAWHFAGAAVPASIRLDAAPTLTVRALDAVPVSKATVLDKDGKPLDPQPPVAWSVEPSAVANLKGTQIVPVGNGEATVKASVGEITSTYA